MAPQTSRFPKTCSGPEGTGPVRLQPRGYRHVGIAFKDGIEQQIHRFGFVGVVAIDHHQNVRLDLLEHAADHVAFALAFLAAHEGAGFAGDFRGGIGAIVVIHPDVRSRQHPFEIGDHFADGQLLLVTGDEDRDARFCAPILHC